MTDSEDHPGSAVHKGPMNACVRPCEHQRTTRHLGCAANNGRRGVLTQRPCIGSQGDVRVEKCDQCVEVTASCCSKECVDRRVLAAQIGIRDGTRSLHTATRATCKLLGGVRRASQHCSDLLER